MIQKIAKLIGLDRAVKWSLLTQLIRMVTGLITMLLMLQYLTTSLQGYAYTFGSVLGISIFLELGFSQNILQFASHEFSKLRLTDDRKLEGDEVALSRLTSLARLSFKYYGIAAVIFAFVTTIGGAWFFRKNQVDDVAWQIPWTIACIASSVTLLLNPCWALLQGCNQVAEIERYRFWSATLLLVLTCTGYVTGMGLYVAPVVACLSMLVAGIYLLIRWSKFFRNFLNKPSNEVICWKTEIWPFQWRIGISWMSGYFLFTIVIPIIFSKVSPSAAGQYGFASALVNNVAAIAASWSTTKLPRYGMLVAQKDWTNLRQLWRKATTHSFIFATIGAFLMVFLMHFLSPYFPNLQQRYAGLNVTLLLAFCMLVQNFTNSCSYVIRAFKEEPYMWPSVIGACINAIFIWLFTNWWGIVGSAMGFALCNIIMFYPTYYIFRRKQLQLMDGTDLIFHQNVV